MNLRTGSLRELQMDSSALKEMCEVAAFTAKKAGAAAHGLKREPLSAEARAIADRLPAPDQPQKTRRPPRTWAAIWRKKSRPAAGGRRPLSCRGAG